VNLRTKLSLVLSILLALSIGATGAILIYESAVHNRTELLAKHQLLAENRAFALRDNFGILENELERLSRLPQIDLSDNNPLPEAQLLDSAHKNSVLYPTAVLAVSPTGECAWSVPETSGYRNQNLFDRPWFQAARADLRGPQIYATDEPGVGRTIKIVQPVVRRARFAGALVGVIALGQDNLITPSLRVGLPPLTDGVLVDNEGRIIYPQAYRADPSSGWAQAITSAAEGAAGTLRASAHGEDSLFAFAPVGAGTNYALVFRWPWWSLNSDLRKQVWALGLVLTFGIILAAAAGLVLSAALTRPLEALAQTARRIGQGDYPQKSNRPRADRSDEIGALVRAFDRMGDSLRQRDNELLEAAAKLEQRVEERTRELRAAQAALVDAERFAAMGKTAAAIAHELKNSMGGLGMAVELILQDPMNRTRVERLRTQVLAEVARLRDVTDALLSFSRAPRLERSQQDLAAIVRSAVGMLGDVITDRGAEVTVDASVPLPVECDGHKMQSVVMNLVKNAVEAGHKVTVRAAAQDGAALIEIADDGPGLSEPAQAHLFEPFFTTKPNGTGLGLPTSHRFVEAHGGSIEVGRASDLGGALFRVRLPREVRSA